MNSERVKGNYCGTFEGTVFNKSHSKNSACESSRLKAVPLEDERW